MQHQAWQEVVDGVSLAAIVGGLVAMAITRETTLSPIVGCFVGGVLALVTYNLQGNRT